VQVGEMGSAGKSGMSRANRLRSRIGLGLAAAIVLIASGGSAISASASSSYHGTATFALAPTQTSRYIFPFTSGAYANDTELFQFQNLMWRPLYWFGNDGEFYVNYKLSIGEPPVYSNGGKTVTITLKHYRWSDGLPVTSRDIEFWLDIYKAEPGEYYGYVPGDMPSNIASMSFPASTPYTFSITFNQAYSPLDLLYNNLSEIFPIPQHVWDRTSASGAVGDYDLTTAGATAVYNFLNAQSADPASWTGNPLWKVVDGPWRLSSFDATTGYDVLVPNPSYSGPNKPKLAKLEEVPFASSTSEFNALRSGQLDYGYLPASDIAQRKYLTSHGYSLASWADWGFNSFWLNYSNPSVGAIFKQLYVRQAMQHLVNQPEIVSDVYHGVAYPSYGPVPLTPKSSFLTSYESHNPYPYSPKAARQLLASHGWSVHITGVDTCSKPGTQADECGAGIAKGAQLNFTELGATGSPEFNAELAVIQSDWSLAGIHLTLKEEPADTIFSEAVPCDAQTGGSGCNWQIADFSPPGFSATFSPQYLPTIAVWLATGGVLNAGAYSSSTLDQLIAATNTVPGSAPYKAEENYVTKYVPWISQPNYPYQLSVISNKLHGTLPQDPNLNIYPEDWSLSG
jgi:peptide/nickel transport system substrate-binding protein